MKLEGIVRLMLTGDLPRDRELYGGLHLQYRVPDVISSDYRLIAYRFGVKVGDNELLVLGRILQEQLPGAFGRDVVATLDDKEYTYEAGDHRVRYCRVFRWVEAGPEQLALPLDVPTRYE